MAEKKDEKKFVPLSEAEEARQTERLTRARIQMLMKFPFFGILALSLKMEMTYDIPTAATDGFKFYYNPYFIKNLEEGEVNWIVVHEVLHPALKHLWRRGDRDHKKFNYACDYAIHCIMMDFARHSNNRELLKMPQGCLYDEKYDGMNAEQIYDAMPKNYDNGNGTLDDHSQWENGETQSNSQQKAADWEGKMVQAAKAAESKMAGNVPGFLKRLLGSLTRPQKDWRALLAEFVEYYNADYAFTPPDRRFSDGDCIMPDFSDPDEEVKKILFWIDTSGSIGDKELNVAYSEIVGAISQFHRLTGYVGFFDHAAYPVTSFEDVDDILKIRPQGGGGTCFNAPFKWITDNMDPEDVAGIVIFTDGYCSWPNESVANGVPVLWLINNESEIPPWGQHGTFKV